MSLLVFLASLLFASQDPQIPPIGIIDFYGLRGVTEQQVREALQIKEGDPVSVDRKEARRRLEALPGVAEARLSLVCCEAGKAIAFGPVRLDSWLLRVPARTVQHVSRVGLHHNVCTTPAFPCR